MKIEINGKEVWMPKGTLDLERKYMAFRSDLYNYLMVFGKITEETEKAMCEKHGVLYQKPTPKREGKFFMAHVDGSSKMLWMDEDGTVFDFTGYPDRANINEQPYTEPWTYWRAVSGFDF